MKEVKVCWWEGTFALIWTVMEVGGTQPTDPVGVSGGGGTWCLWSGG